MLFLRPLGGQKTENVDRICLTSFCKIVIPVQAGSTIFKKCDAKSELEHENDERGTLKLAFLMQSGINGYEIYKNVGMMHAVVFADEAQEAKNAQVMGQTQNPKGLKKRKISERNGPKSDKSEINCENKHFSSRLGVNKVIFLMKNARSRFTKLCSPCGQEAQFSKNVMRKMN